MWQKEDEDIQWAKKSETQNKQGSGPHPDYQTNLFMAQNFINKVTPNLRPDMILSLNESVLTISLNAGRSESYSTWAHPIGLHQSKQTFAKSLEIVFNDYVRKAQKFESRRDLHA